MHAGRLGEPRTIAWITTSLLLMLPVACGRAVVEFPGVPVGKLEIDPLVLDFGVIFVADTGSKAVNLTWGGDEEVTLALQLAGDRSGTFAIPTAAVTLSPGERISIAIVSDPNAPGAPSAVLHLLDETGASQGQVSILAEAQTDGDDDGYGSVATGGADCDDVDSTRHPGAEERWYDGVDSDCGGDDDYDQDHDQTDVDIDCDDTDPDVGEASAELWNGRDDDCDGERDNLDIALAAAGWTVGGDRQTALGLPGTLSIGHGIDCGEGVMLIIGGPGETHGAAWILPAHDLLGANEAVEDLASTTLHADASFPVGFFPEHQADLTGDGTDDLLIVGHTYEGTMVGGAWLLEGGPDLGAGDTIEDVALFRFLGRSGNPTVHAATAADLDGDGQPEVVIGASHDSHGNDEDAGNIAVYNLAGEHANMGEDDPQARIYGEAAYTWLGWSVHTADVDDDGYVDILAAAPGDDEGGDDAGTLYRFAGNTTLTWDSTAEAASVGRVFGTTRNGYLGLWGVGSTGDNDGDGLTDWLIGSPWAGLVVLETNVGALGGPHAIEDAARVWAFSGGDCGAGVDAGTDLDGDGVDEVLVGCPEDDEAGRDAGLVYRLEGRAPSMRDSQEVLATLYGEEAGDQLGGAIIGGEDLDGDGREDALVGAPGNDRGGEESGIVYLLTGFGADAP